jgi:hypothetical protein
MSCRLFGDIKLWYGAMLGFAIHTAWFQLLAGLVLNAWTTKLGVSHGSW